MLSVSFFVFLVGPAYGAGIAEVVTRTSGNKRGHVIEAIGVGSIVIGAAVAIGLKVIPLVAVAAKLGSGATTGGLIVEVVTGSVFPLLGIALAISTCYSKLKYF